jgi:endonuclease YncB( thermonuclease family)
MRKFGLSCALFTLLLLSCSLFSSLTEATLQVPTSTPMLVLPSPSVSLTLTQVLVPSFTPSETAQPPSETPIQSASPSSSATATPTVTPFPTILPLACLPPQATPEFGQVKWVQDGNTIMVDIQGRLTSVRYLGIQSPNNLPNIQYMGPPAATQNAALVLGQIVQMVPDGAQRDQSGQLLRYVLLYNTQTFVNFEMLRLGLAQTAPDTSGLACDQTFTLIQEQARQAQVGLWAPTPTLFPSATPRPTRTQTATKTKAPTSAFSPTPSHTTIPITPSPSPTPGTPTAIPTSVTPSPSGTLPTTTASPSPSVTGTPLPTETQALPPVQPTATTAPTGVQIVDIFYHGTASNESDEYVEIKNYGPSSVNLYNWWISEENEFSYFVFDQVTLGAGQSCRIYTNQTTGINWCGNFESTTPVWDNASDCGKLYNSNDEVVSSFCYP